MGSNNRHELYFCSKLLCFSSIHCFFGQLRYLNMRHERTLTSSPLMLKCSERCREPQEREPAHTGWCLVIQPQKCPWYFEIGSNITYSRQQQQQNKPMKYYEILPTHTDTPRNTTRKIANLYIEFNYHFLTLQKKIPLLLNRSVQPPPLSSSSAIILCNPCVVANSSTCIQMIRSSASMHLQCRGSKVNSRLNINEGTGVQAHGIKSYFTPWSFVHSDAWYGTTSVVVYLTSSNSAIVEMDRVSATVDKGSGNLCIGTRFLTTEQ